MWIKKGKRGRARSTPLHRSAKADQARLDCRPGNGHTHDIRSLICATSAKPLDGDTSKGFFHQP